MTLACALPGGDLAQGETGSQEAEGTGSGETGIATETWQLPYGHYTSECLGSFTTGRIKIYADQVGDVPQANCHGYDSGPVSWERIGDTIVLDGAERSLELVADGVLVQGFEHDCSNCDIGSMWTHVPGSEP